MSGIDKLRKAAQDACEHCDVDCPTCPMGLVERIAELEAGRDRLRAALLSAPPARSRNVALDYESWYRTNVEPLKDGRG